MNDTQRTEFMQGLSAYGTWAVVTALWMYFAISNAPRFDDVWPAAFALALVNLGALWAVLRAETAQAPVWVLLLHLASGLAVGWLMSMSFLPIYTIIWIALAANYFSLRACWWWLVGIAIAWYVIMTYSWGYQNAWVNVLLFTTFHVFSLLMARSLIESERQRDAMQALNRELLATQQLLAEASRQSERTRIARDLHDLLGHHLTALTINLQIAEHISDGDAKDKVAESRALARLLLSDVREAVDRLREDQGVDLGEALSVLAANVPGLTVSVNVADGLHIDDVEVAQAIVRCAQEAITNTLRHSGATECRIDVSRDSDSLVLSASDNGRVEPGFAEGNGLTGMRERVEALHGKLSINQDSGAMSLRAVIPFGS